MDIALPLLALQALLGAFDNLWNHEWKEKLPGCYSARRELALHAVRGMLYAPIFVSFGWLAWQGLWAWMFATVLAIEIVVTSLDFIEEDRTRKLGAHERVLHTVLAINYGAVLALVAPEIARWSKAPTDLVLVTHGAWSWAMSVFALGAGAWGVRDGIAAWRLFRRDLATAMPPLKITAQPKPRTILVAGATGFIGRALTRRLISSGQRVIVLARDVEKARRLFGNHARAVASLDDIGAHAHVDAIVNLAGEPIAAQRWSPARKAVLVESRVGVTRLLVEWMARRQREPAVLVSASAVGYYGAQGDTVTAETAAAGDDFAAKLCRAWEREARAAERLGTRVALLRFGLVLGNGGLLARMTPVFRLGIGAPFGSGAQPMPWIHIEDALEVIEQALADRYYAGPINVVAPERADNRAFACALARSLGRPLWPAIPALPLQWLFGEMASLLLDGRQVAPAKLVALSHPFRFRTLDAALADLTASDARAPRLATAVHHG